MECMFEKFLRSMKSQEKFTYLRRAVGYVELLDMSVNNFMALCAMFVVSYSMHYQNYLGQMSQS